MRIVAFLDSRHAEIGLYINVFILSDELFSIARTILYSFVFKVCATSRHMINIIKVCFELSRRDTLPERWSGERVSSRGQQHHREEIISGKCFVN